VRPAWALGERPDVVPLRQHTDAERHANAAAHALGPLDCAFEVKGLDFEFDVM
jgi:hypothetical protein